MFLLEVEIYFQYFSRQREPYVSRVIRNIYIKAKVATLGSRAKDKYAAAIFEKQHNQY